MAAAGRARVLSAHVAAPRAAPAAAPAAGQGGKMLAGLKVVELATMVAAPSATALLCDYGAEVVKIESPNSPDLTRSWGRGDSPEKTADPALRSAPGGGGSAFTQFNRGKRCIALDPTKPEGKELLLRLVAGADVFVTNVRSKSLVKMGLDYDALAPRFPKLIYGHLTAYGRSGPMQNDPGYDFGAFWTYTGIADGVKSSADAPLPKFISSFGDNITASTLFGGVLGALYHRERTGRGQLVDASLIRAGLWAMNDPMARVLGGNAHDGFNSVRGGVPGGALPTYGAFRCSDGVWLQLLGIEFSRHLPKLLRATGLRAETLFGGQPKPTKDTDWGAATRIVDATMASRPAAEWERVFREHDVWHVRVNAFKDMPGDAQAKAVGTFVDVPGVRHPLVGSPVLLSDAPSVPAAGGARHGQHTDEVLRGIGCTDDDLRRLRGGKVVR